MSCCCRFEKILTCDCCAEGLRKAISENFCPGDFIGVTFIDQGTASIAVGIFRSVTSGVLEVDDLLVDGTTSFVPLCDISSIEKDITPPDGERKNSIKVPLKRSVTF